MRLRLCFALASLLLARIVSAQAYGTGRTYGEAMARAQANARSQKMWGDTWAAMGRYVREKEEIARKLKEARAEYWEAAAKGAVPKATEERYHNVLWQKDFHYLGRELVNAAAPIRGVPGVRGGADFMNGLSVMLTNLDSLDQIHPYARKEFDTWVGRIQMRAPDTNEHLLQSLIDTREEYASYIRRRDIAEYLFVNPYSPLRSNDSLEYLSGFYLAKDVSPTLPDAERRVSALQKLAGRQAIEEAVSIVKAEEAAPKRRSPLDDEEVEQSVARVVGEYVEWLVMKRDPQLYALQLIKRRSRFDWDVVTAIGKERARRVGADQMRAATEAAFRDADDPKANCVGNPRVQIRKTSTLSDCVADRLGPLTLWNDVYELSVARMTRAAAKAKVMKLLAKSAKRGDPEKRYARIVAVVSEPVLLASVYAHDKWGFDRLAGNSDGLTSGGVFRGETYLLSTLAAARDDRSFVVMTLMDGIENNNDLTRLELAIDEYHRRVASLGGPQLLAAAATIRKQVVPTYTGVSGYQLPLLAAARGEQPVIAERPDASNEGRERARLLGRIKYLASKQFEENLQKPVMRHYARSESGRDAFSPIMQATADEKEIRESFDKASGALYAYEQNKRDEDLRAGLEAARRAIEKLEFAYQCLSEVDPRMRALQEGGRGDLVKPAREVLDYYEALASHQEAAATPEPGPSGSATHEGYETVQRDLRLDGPLEDAVIFLRGPNDDQFFDAGPAKRFSRRGRPLPLNEDGKWQIKIEREGIDDLILYVIVGDEGLSELRIK